MTDRAAVSTVLSRAPVGLAAPLVRVEVHLSSGLPSFALVGLPEAVVRESKERVRSAIINAGFDFPAGRITVNLSPADLPKEGGRFDLPIAVGILAASAQLPSDVLDGREFYGELSLGGELRPTRKLLPALVAAVADGRELIVPAANVVEARLAASTKVSLAASLAELCRALRRRCALPGPLDVEVAVAGAARAGVSIEGAALPDLADIKGQAGAKRALEIAAAGEHALLMIGPPGTGKTLLAQRLPTLLPPLGRAAALEVASLESAAGRVPSSDSLPPFRSPQHTASVAALIGGEMRPGELSLAHRGVLFLDELPEFSRNVLEALREPLESGVVVVSRLKREWEFPARFQLVAAMNPCPCGYAGDPRGRCRCAPGQIARYRNRISGPLIDRIDMHVVLPPMPVEELVHGGNIQPATTDTSAQIARRVAAARNVAQARQGKLNARLSTNEAVDVCRLDHESRNVLSAAINRLGLSARAYHRILKLARSCADLDAATLVRREHVAEAVMLRALDRPIC